MKFLNILLFLLLINLVIFAQASNDEFANRVHAFEADWLKANLNSDQQWKQNFTDGKLMVVAADKSAIDERAFNVAAILDPTLSANEMKVRITGTITLITNDHKKDRSFRFLDTFNKKGDKWEMIATGLTATNELPVAIDKNSIESQLTGLENSLSRSAVGNDRSVLENMIATDFVGTTADGVLQTRKEWLSSIETQRYKTQVDNVVVHLVSDTVAIVIGTLLENRTDNSSPSKQRFTHTWMNREGHWQLVASQLTAIR